MKSIRISPPEGGFKPTDPHLNSPRCKDCPEFDKGWCKLMARTATPMAGMCEWGKRKRASAASAAWRERNKMKKKNETKTTMQDASYTGNGFGVSMDVFGWGVAWTLLKLGKAVKRTSWLGYWVMEGEELVMRCKDGRVVTFPNCETTLTLENIAAHDWMTVGDTLRRELDAIHRSGVLAGGVK